MIKPSLPTLVDFSIEYHIGGGYYFGDDEEEETDDAGLCHELKKMLAKT